nr:hypothetical protein [Chthoniobacter flavus]
MIIIALIPLALKGVKFRPARPRRRSCSRNLLLYGVGGRHRSPFVGIKAIDIVISALHLA